MNIVTDADTESAALTEVIEMKWLLAGEGLRLHVERLFADAEYALQVLDLASRSPTLALRETACRLRLRLAPALP
jgi:hypothetical protein